MWNDALLFSFLRNLYICWKYCSHICHAFVSQTRLSHEKYMHGIFMSAFIVLYADIRAISSVKWMKASSLTDKMDNMDQSEPEEEQPSPDGVRLESILFWCHDNVSPTDVSPIEKSRIIRLLDNASLGLVVFRRNIYWWTMCPVSPLHSYQTYPVTMIVTTKVVESGFKCKPFKTPPPSPAILPPKVRDRAYEDSSSMGCIVHVTPRPWDALSMGLFVWRYTAVGDDIRNSAQFYLNVVFDVRKILYQKMKDFHRIDYRCALFPTVNCVQPCAALVSTYNFSLSGTWDVCFGVHTLLLDRWERAYCRFL
jgi:hypothetical protein